jgi:hypothetical protein
LLPSVCNSAIKSRRLASLAEGVFAPRFATFGMQFGDKKPEAMASP